MVKTSLFLALAVLLLRATGAWAMCPEFELAMKSLDKSVSENQQDFKTRFHGWLERVETCRHVAGEEGYDAARIKELHGMWVTQNCMGLVCEGLSFEKGKLDQQDQEAYKRAQEKLADAGISEANVECYYPEKDTQ